MRCKFFPIFILTLILELQALSAQAKPKHCTIACETDPAITCTSRAGDCQFYYGAYDYIVCDGIATQCPLPSSPQSAVILGLGMQPRTCSPCTVTCPNNPAQSCTSETGQCESGLVGGTYWIGCDGGADECVPPR
ncbi:MAG TPA: hypothetical protein VGG03_11565 [Thermoanaerobaculia bacterium]|jgi:hypothetical protein